MKKFITLFSMMVMLAFTSQAAYYLVGSEPFGTGWSPNSGIEMTQESDGSYSYKATINGTVWFVLADGLAESASDWDTFNNVYRFGPTTGVDQAVTAGAWVTTQRQGSGSGSYMFTGTGSEYVIKFIPAAMMFMIDGYVAPPDPTQQFYTVCGTPAAVFGTEWAPSNTDNDMEKQEDGTYKLTKPGCELSAGVEFKYKVAYNHDWAMSWPANDVVVPVEESGTYDVTFTFDPNAEEPMPECTLVKTGDGPDLPVLTGEVYILGEVNGNGWDPSNGLKMETEDENIFKAQITTDGANIDENDGIGYSFFSFTTKLGENSDDWSGISPYRFGSTQDGLLLSEDLFGIDIELGNFGTSNSFKVPAGTYDLTVNLDAKTLVINKHEEPEPPVEGYKIVKVWENTDLSFMATNDVRQGFGMDGMFYFNNKADQSIMVVGKDGLTNTTYPGGANCGISRDEAGNLVISNAAFPGAWTEATIKVVNPETSEVKEYTIPEECGVAGRCDFIGFAKGNLMEDGVLYLTGATNTGISVLTITGGEVNTDECYEATCEGLSPTTSTVINFFTDLNGDDAPVYVTRNANPLKLAADGDGFTATALVLPGKGSSNGAFPFIWEDKEYVLYPYKTAEDKFYLDGFAIAEPGAEEPIVIVPSTYAAPANSFQANWLNTEVDDEGVTIYQYYPGGYLAVYRLTNEQGGIEELINDSNKVVAGIRYYNIMGQEMKQANGITIIVTTYTDGSSSAVKIIK